MGLKTPELVPCTSPSDLMVTAFVEATPCTLAILELLLQYPFFLMTLDLRCEAQDPCY